MKRYHEEIEEYKTAYFAVNGKECPYDIFSSKGYVTFYTGAIKYDTFRITAFRVMTERLKKRIIPEPTYDFGLIGHIFNEGPDSALSYLTNMLDTHKPLSRDDAILAFWTAYLKKQKSA